MNAVTGTPFNPICNLLPIELRRRVKGLYFVGPGHGALSRYPAYKQQRARWGSPSADRRRKKRIGIKPASIRKAEAEAKWAQVPRAE